MHRIWGRPSGWVGGCVLAGAGVALGLGSLGPAHAGTGQAVSAPFALDTRDPSVAQVQPADGATDLPRVLDVVVRFGSGIDPASLSAATVQIEGSASGVVDRTLTYQPEALLLSARPAPPFALGERVTVRLSAGIRDAFGNPLTPARTWSFTVGQHTPELMVDRVTVEVSGQARIAFTSGDPD
ncbi:MAG: Ig-like domain-containing protein, partial [Candidatus Latescibacterota bacterium]